MRVISELSNEILVLFERIDLSNLRRFASESMLMFAMKKNLKNDISL